MPIKRDPAFVRTLSFFALTISPFFTFISIFLLWFSIVAPTPFRNGPVFFQMTSKGAAKILSEASGKSETIFNSIPETNASMWVGIFGSCYRPATSLDVTCSSSSFYPNYNASFSSVRYISSDLLFNQIYNHPAVPVPVWVVVFLLFMISFVLSIFGNFPHYGADASWDISKKWNLTPGVWRMKYWIVTGQKGKWMIFGSLVALCSAWILGFTATLAMFAQWQQVVGGWNFYYGQLLAQDILRGDKGDPNVGPILLAAIQPESAYIMQWILWVFIAFEILARFYSYHKFPTSIPLYPTNSEKKVTPDPSISDFPYPTKVATKSNAPVMSGKSFSSASNFSSTAKFPDLRSSKASVGDDSVSLHTDAFDKIVDLKGTKGERKEEVWV